MILIAVLLFVLLGGTQRASAGAFTSCASVTQIPVAECDALVALYNSTNLGSWVYIANNWLVTDTPGDWYGVTVANGHVEGLSLSAQYHGDVLVGSIPPELGSLANLKVLDLYDNQLSGSIPPELGNLANLQDLDLSSSQLRGIIPSELGNLANLQDLNLSWNQLSGGIPTQLGNLTSLLDLRLNSNQLSGIIPPELGNLVNLQDLNLSWNQLSGIIPTQLSNLAKLQ